MCFTCFLLLLDNRFTSRSGSRAYQQMSCLKNKSLRTKNKNVFAFVVFFFCTSFKNRLSLISFLFRRILHERWRIPWSDVAFLSDSVKENREKSRSLDPSVVKCCVVILQLLIMTLVVIRFKLKTEQKKFFSVLKSAAASGRTNFYGERRNAFSITTACSLVLLLRQQNFSGLEVNNLACGYEGGGLEVEEQKLIKVCSCMSIKNEFFPALDRVLSTGTIKCVPVRCTIAANAF